MRLCTRIISGVSTVDESKIHYTLSVRAKTVSFLYQKGMKMLNCGDDVGWRSDLLSFKDRTDKTTGECVCI